MLLTNTWGKLCRYLGKSVVYFDNDSWSIVVYIKFGLILTFCAQKVWCLHILYLNWSFQSAIAGIYIYLERINFNLKITRLQSKVLFVYCSISIFKFNAKMCILYILHVFKTTTINIITNNNINLTVTCKCKLI